MKTPISSFINEIGHVREYIKHIELVNKMASDKNNIYFNDFNAHLQKFRVEKKLFEYKSITISLYGILEKNVSIWVLEHASSLESTISSYESIPDSIKKKHFNLSVKLISLISEGRHSKYEELDKELVLKKLSNCIADPNNFNLNSEAFTPMSGNLKHSKIVDAFRPLDIDLNEKLKNDDKFVDFLERNFGKNIINKGDELYFLIDELVSRRNDIAHGRDIDNILNITEFDDYMRFLEEYGNAIFRIIEEKEIEYEANFNFTRVENIKGVFKHKILCFEIEDTTLNLGDPIIVKTPSNHYIKKYILGIQVKNKDQNSITTVGKIDVGVELENGLTDKQLFYIKS